MSLDYSLSCHFRPASGWMNDPNGLIEYKGYYHLFYQCCPHFETPWREAMYWGHARTKDFLHWEELPLALSPTDPFDNMGCWSGTAIEKDGRLYLFYASIRGGRQEISVAWSDDGVTFEKYAENPVISEYPPEGSGDFRDPAVLKWEENGHTGYRLVIASGNEAADAGRLLLYRSGDLLHWDYDGVVYEVPGAHDCECPSFLRSPDGTCVLATSIEYHKPEQRKDFVLMSGSFDGRSFTPAVTSHPQKGPDQYAGQIFTDKSGRHILITWIPGWHFAGYGERSVSCMSLPMEVTVTDRGITTYPVAEVRHLLTDTDPAIERTADGFVVRRTDREDVTFTGEIREMAVLRDNYVLEIFINHGEQVVSVILC